MHRDRKRLKQESADCGSSSTSVNDLRSKKHTSSASDGSHGSWLKRIERSGKQAGKAIDAWKCALIHLLSIVLLAILAWDILKEKLGL